MPLFYLPNAYTFLQVFSLLSFFFTNLLTKFFSASFSVSLTEIVIVLFLVKKSWRALRRHCAVAAPFFLSLSLFSFLFFFFWSKKSLRRQKHSMAKSIFCPKLTGTLMRVQHLTKSYDWSFNNGDLVLWVYKCFIFLIKIVIT